MSYRGLRVVRGMVQEREKQIKQLDDIDRTSKTIGKIEK